MIYGACCYNNYAYSNMHFTLISKPSWVRNWRGRKWINEELGNWSFDIEMESHSSPRFSAVYAALVDRNHFYCLYCQMKTYASKVKFRQAKIVAMGLLKLPNLLMLIKQKSLWLSRNSSLAIFGELLIISQQR